MKSFNVKTSTTLTGQKFTGTELINALSDQVEASAVTVNAKQQLVRSIVARFSAMRVANNADDKGRPSHNFSTLNALEANDALATFLERHNDGQGADNIEGRYHDGRELLDDELLTVRAAAQLALRGVAANLPAVEPLELAELYAAKQ